MKSILRMSAVLAVVLLAVLGVLLVLDLIPREQFNSLTVKGLTIVAITAAASLAIGLLSNGDKSDKT